MTSPAAITRDEWAAEATRRFGDDPMNWKFICPACKHVASVRDYKEAKAPQSVVGFSCIGRYVGARRDAFGLNPDNKSLPKAEGPGPCNYAGGGLFKLNPVQVDFDGVMHSVFAFADEPAKQAPGISEASQPQEPHAPA